MMKFFGMVFACILLSSCATIQMPIPVEDVISMDQNAILRLDVSHFRFEAPDSSGSCTAFHIGDGVFVSAAHCVEDPKLISDMYLEDLRGFRYYPTILKLDEKRDLVLLHVNHYTGSRLNLWDEKEDGPMPLGMEIMGIGFPGYFYLNFTFEVAYYKGSFDIGGVKYVFSKDLTYQGYSGGPIISCKNGKVIGITHVIFDRKKDFEDTHQHAWMSQSVSVYELESLLKE